MKLLTNIFLAISLTATSLTLSSCAFLGSDVRIEGQEAQPISPCSVQTYQDSKFTVSSWKTKEPLLVGIGKLVCTKPAKMIFQPGVISTHSQSDQFYLSLKARNREVGVLTQSAVGEMHLQLKHLSIAQPIELPEGESQLVTWITAPNSEEDAGTVLLTGTVQVSDVQGEPADSPAVKIGSNINFQRK